MNIGGILLHCNACISGRIYQSPLIKNNLKGISLALANSFQHLTIFDKQKRDEDKISYRTPVLFKGFHSTVTKNKFGDRILYVLDKKEHYKKEDKRSMIDKTVDGLKTIKDDIGLWKEELRDRYLVDPILVTPGIVDKVIEINSEEDVAKWIVTSDSSHMEGFSTGSFTFSSTGHGLFKGRIDTRVPKTGDIKYAGYSNVTIYPPRKSFARDSYFNWSLYTHLVLRVRGDGRSYMLVLGTAGYFDITWHDQYNYVLYTRGGPYWQTTKIPLSKFFMSAKGRVQDKLEPIPKERICRFGITAADKINAPFSLEIDYIGVEYDANHTEEYAYESYPMPKFYSI